MAFQWIFTGFLQPWIFIGRMNPKAEAPNLYVVVIQLLSHFQLFVTQWTTAHQASLSFTVSQSLLRITSIESISSSVTPFSCLHSFPASGSFPVSWPFASGGQSIRGSASAAILPMNIQDWFPLGLTGWISWQSKELSRVFSKLNHSSKHQFFTTQFSF